ncbi:flagellar hook-basal body complex protein FliE [Paraburkholderia bonniea]|uniref:flagellar hook-basal body complex protein FliE n=1 Tax=Paraburkholderia bonniea TaxID=2152891 RepID=UPI0012914C68|nr:flagellar hook-basal body complex protein FliE [Paraburkholderia bonniea]WJF90771.1 flagellar hook-basal body complex protein FliE [Paraburkholderia bonniea]WJF94085.1 flagellar hook-basal body complex protein FliE [Paraburkholderia bonniea]
MNVESLSPMLTSILTQGTPAESAISENAAPQAATPVNFTDTFKQALMNVDDQQHQASQKVAAVDRGDNDDLVGAMLSSQQASLSFSMLIQVRNKMMNAFDDIIKMQV